MKYIVLSVIVLLLISTGSCKKDENVPKAYVDLLLQLNLPQYVTLNTINNWVYVPGGNRGIIVYRRSSQDFIALEQTCTYDAENTVKVEGNNITAHDSICGSKFQITDGSVTQGPATRSLVQYRVDYNASDNTLHIYN